MILCPGSTTTRTSIARPLVAPMPARGMQRRAARTERRDHAPPSPALTHTHGDAQPAETAACAAQAATYSRLQPPHKLHSTACAGLCATRRHCQSTESAPSPLRARQAMVLSTMLIAPLLQAAAVAKTNGCIFTSACSVVSPRPGEPEKLRVHTIFYNNGRVGDLPGSWLLAAIHDGVLDCGGNGATRQSDSGRRTLWIGGPFSPLRNVSSPEEAELLFLPLESAFNDVGSDQMLRDDAAVRLDPCDGTSARHVLNALGEIDDKIQFVWDAPPMARRTWLPLSTVMSHVSARARVVLALSQTPDVSTEVLENGLRFVMGQGFGGGDSRVLVMHYRAGTTCAPPHARTTSCAHHLMHARFAAHSF